MRFIHTADLHLNVSLSHASFKNARAHDNRLYEIKDTFFKLLEHAENAQVDMLFIAGDLFDDPSIKLHEIESVFDRLKNLSCEVFLLIGNHDVFLQEKAYQSLLNAKNIHSFTKDNPSYDMGDTVVHGINTDHYDPSFFHALDQSLDPTKQHILLLHGDVINKQDDHFLSDINTLSDSKFDYIALGHIHKHAFLKDHIAYSGNLEPLDFTETESRGFIEGTLKDHHLSARFVPFQKRRFITTKITINENDSEDDIRQKIAECVSEDEKTNHFHRIEIHGDRGEMVEIHPSKLMQYFQDSFYYIEIKDKTQIAINLDALKDTYKDTIISALIEQYESIKSATDEDYTAMLEALKALMETEDKR